MRILDDDDLDDINAIYEEVSDLANRAAPNEVDRFSILHAPALFKNIPCMLIGRCPADGILDGVENEEEIWPPHNILTKEKNIYSLTATSFFHRAERLAELEVAQSSDISFFRQRHGSNRVGRRTLNTLSFDYLLELMDIFNPASIIAVGRRSMRKLHPDGDQIDFGQEFVFQGRRTVGIVHLSTPTQFRQDAITRSIEGINRVVPQLRRHRR